MGVVLGLEQSGDDERPEIADAGGLGFEAEVGLEPLGEYVAVAVPPALPAGVPGELDEGVRLVALDAVDLKDLPDVSRLGADHTGLDTADAGTGAVELLAHLIAGEAEAQAESAEFDAEAL